MGLNPAFTPTSVIRKMANDKLDNEKEKLSGDTPPPTSGATVTTTSDTAAAGETPPVMRLISDTAAALTSQMAARESRATTSIGTLEEGDSGNISIPVPQVPHNTPQTPAQVGAGLCRLFSGCR